MMASSVMALLFSKLPIRQVTKRHKSEERRNISKLPIRQVTQTTNQAEMLVFSKLPIRQVTSAVLL